jgi:hypothetical protein
MPASWVIRGGRGSCEHQGRVNTAVFGSGARRVFWSFREKGILGNFGNVGGGIK